MTSLRMSPFHAHPTSAGRRGFKAVAAATRRVLGMTAPTKLINAALLGRALALFQEVRTLA